jgi:hypothetical protein
MRNELTENILLLIVVMTVVIAFTARAKWSPVDYIDSPIKEPEAERVVLNHDTICNMDLCT